MTTMSHNLRADAFPLGKRLMYLDRDGPGQVTVRVGVVAGECRNGEGGGLLVPLTDEDGTERLVPAADVLGSGSRSGNSHETNRPARWRHHLSPTGRHHRREDPAE